MELRCARHIINIKRLGEVGAFASELQPPSLFAVASWNGEVCGRTMDTIAKRCVHFAALSLSRVPSDTRDEARRRRIEALAIRPSYVIVVSIINNVDLCRLSIVPN